jgi:hypothetical protein
MSLRDDIKVNKDYVLVGTSSWLKLVAAFGGAPEIPIYQYTVEERETQPDGTSMVVKHMQHDFNPIKVHVTGIDNRLK